MLDGLDAIDWASLTHAYGEATDIPDLLRALLSADAEVREGALYALFGNIWHQGTVYPATAAAVPFLYELLTAPETPDKVGVADLLACIAMGRGYLEVHATGRGKGAFEREMLAKQGKSLEAEIEREAREIQAVRRAVSPRLPLLLPLLRNSESESRWYLVDALGRYPEHKALTVPALQAAVAVETDDEVRRAMNACIARLTGSPP